MMEEKLLSEALKASEMSYSPYSNFRVGAALLTEDERIFTGTNVENRSYGGTICAERAAIVKAISEGSRSFKAIAIVSPDYEELLPPCGICRQFIAEFGSHIKVIIADNRLNYKVLTISELLPFDSLTELKEKQQ